MAANESAAVASVRSLSTAETAYAATYPAIGYTCELSELGPPASGNPVSSLGAGIIDAVLASGEKQGYLLSLSNCTGTPRSTYSSAAAPKTPGASGIRSFCSDASGVIWYAGDGTAATCRSAGLVLR